MKIAIALLAASAMLGARPGFAQETFPNRPVQLILPFGPGGSDAMFRAFAQSMM